MLRRCAILLSVAALLIQGCGITAMVTDFSGSKTKVRHVEVSEGGKSVLVIHGETIQEVELSKIDKVSFFPAATRTTDGRMYFQAGILMANGSEVGYSDDPKAGTVADAFICIDGTLSGETEQGDYSIGLDKIMELDIDP